MAKLENLLFALAVPGEPENNGEQAYVMACDPTVTGLIRALTPIMELNFTVNTQVRRVMRAAIVNGLKGTGEDREVVVDVEGEGAFCFLLQNGLPEWGN